MTGCPVAGPGLKDWYQVGISVVFTGKKHLERLCHDRLEGSRILVTEEA